MWPFRKKQEESGGAVKKLVAGLIIGGAIGSIIGKNMMDKHAGNGDAEEDEDDE